MTAKRLSAVAAAATLALTIAVWTARQALTAEVCYVCTRPTTGSMPTCYRWELSYDGFATWTEFAQRVPRNPLTAAGDTVRTRVTKGRSHQVRVRCNDMNGRLGVYSIPSQALVAS